MSEETPKSKGGSLPPKLDLRKTGVLKGHVWPAPDDDENQAAADVAREESSAEPTAAPASATPAANPVAKPALGSEKTVAKPVLSTMKAAPSAKPLAAKPVPNEPAGGAVPKAVPARPVALGATVPRPGTARIKVPSEGDKNTPAPASAVTPRPGLNPSGIPAAKAKPVSKRETSKIPLEMAAPPGGNKVTSTIKIKPAVKPVAVKPAVPAAAALKEVQSPSAVPSPSDADHRKRQTSRIPLESALAADTGDKERADAPKTIRLKRPGGPSTLKASVPPAGGESKSAPSKTESASTEEATKTASTDKGALGKTSRLDDAAAEPDSATLTRKKTIRVKRPTQTTGVKKELSVARPDTPTQGSSSGLQPPVPFEEPPERVGWFFGLCGIAATLVAGMVIYVLLAQVLGSGPSLTQLSYGAPGANLPWMGEVRGD